MMKPSVGIGVMGLLVALNLFLVYADVHGAPVDFRIFVGTCVAGIISLTFLGPTWIAEARS